MSEDCTVHSLLETLFFLARSGTRGLLLRLAACAGPPVPAWQVLHLARMASAWPRHHDPGSDSPAPTHKGARTDRTPAAPSVWPGLLASLPFRWLLHVGHTFLRGQEHRTASEVRRPLSTGQNPVRRFLREYLFWRFDSMVLKSHNVHIRKSHRPCIEAACLRIFLPPTGSRAPTATPIFPNWNCLVRPTLEHTAKYSWRVSRPLIAYVTHLRWVA